MLAISSRKSVPPSASLKRPSRSALASVNAPATCPNSSLSKSVSGMLAVLTLTRDLSLRVEAACSTRATIPLPAPFSPVIRTLACEGPTRAIASSTGCIARASAIMNGRLSPRSRIFSCSSCRPLRNARPSSTWVRSTASSRSFFHGLVTKSRAPRRIASTASSTLPQAVITTTGSVLSIC